MPEFVCQFFGSPKFFVDGRPVKPDRRKAVALAAFLIVHGKSISRERLADLFWPNFGRTSALASLRRTLSVMGKVLGKHWFEANRETICFVPNENISVDVAQFQALISRHSTNSDALEPDVLEKAAQMYSGSFLSDFSLYDAPEFDEWQFARKEAFEREFIQIINILAQRHETLGNDDKAIKYASVWAEYDPLNESAHRCLIRLFGRTGQKGLVKQQYDRCRQLLDTELGIPPDSKTAQLAEKALGPGSFPVKQIPTARDLFPEQSFAFIGRPRELTAISVILIQHGARLLTLTGPGGIGKTRLALEFATKERISFAHGVFFLPLANISCLDAMMAALSERLGLLPDKRTSVLQQVQDFLRDKKILLVLDNLEHLEGINEQICLLLDNTRHLKILATSRSRLELGREQVLSVSGLDCPLQPPGKKTEQIKTFFEAQAPALFIAAVRRVQPYFVPHAGNLHDIMRVCRLTSGIPLALILAGGWGDTYCVRDIADQIEKSIDFLQVGQADVPPSHRSIRAVFDTSWNSLSQQEKRIFMNLAVFRGSFCREAASAVAGTFDQEPDCQGLSGIIRKSLVRLDPVTGLLSLHTLISQYAEEQLVSSGTQEMVLNRHQAYYLGMVRTGEEELIGPKMMAYRTDMDLAFANIEQAWNRAVLKKDIASLSSAAAGLYVYFDMHGNYLNGQRLFSAAKPLAENQQQPFNPVSGLLMVCWFDMHTQSVNAKPSFDQVLGFAHQWLRSTVKSSDDLSRAHALLLMGAVSHKKKSISGPFVYINKAYPGLPG
ncbi:BTAD domain-containing putative transcriptional regulator [uncultured Desulfobacter sp.]|uniref:AfsR/SARP family transcriptional regulator n=1 Tax=uncultured Desulfobacter sp. TaxID=240139 RepID=UPI002AAAF44B|nr:BTAD domain-containing putative transcriptional regulator [uncultured Desulfobacter sp.]